QARETQRIDSPCRDLRHLLDAAVSQHAACRARRGTVRRQIEHQWNEIAKGDGSGHLPRELITRRWSPFLHDHDRPPRSCRGESGETSRTSAYGTHDAAVPRTTPAIASGEERL